MSSAERTQRALTIARRSAHQHAFDRAFQKGGEVALPQITVRPDDDQQPLDTSYDPLAAATAAPSPALAQIGRSVADWWQRQPSWLEQAAAVRQQSDPTSLRPTQAEIDFASGMVGPAAIKGMATEDSLLDAIHGMANTPRDVAEQAMRDNAGRGLGIDSAEGLDRLRQNLVREQKAQAKGTELPGMPANDRTVIKAPADSGLPDFVVGRPTFQDWTARHEQLLSPEQIQKSAQWYKDIYGQFLQQTNGDEVAAKRYMRSWLVAQQNVDVSGAMHNVLLQQEQIARGVPPGAIRAGGMPNPTMAARNVLRGEPVTGIGQKIADFVDAAEGKNVRSWMANHPEGGAPFVVDVHTARDTGLVDQELKNHLLRLGYDQDAVAGLKTDLLGTPSATQYENRAKFGRDLTAYLNKIGWQGRQDWTPEQVQAVGWMGMTKLTGGRAEDVVTGLQSNVRSLSMELSPGEGSPWAQKYGDRFAALPPELQRDLTYQITDSAIRHASRLAGVDVRNIVHGTGGWQNFQSPSTVAQAFASKEGAEIAANALGHLLNQTEVWATKTKLPTVAPKAWSFDLVDHGRGRIGTEQGIRDLWQKIIDLDPFKGTPGQLFQGYQPFISRDGHPGIRILIDRGGAKVAEAIRKVRDGPISAMLQAEPGDWHTYLNEAEITKARNDWRTQANGQGYTSRLVQLTGRDPTADLHSAGQELETKFRAALEAAEAKSRPQQRWQGGQVRPQVKARAAAGGRMTAADMAADMARRYAQQTVFDQAFPHSPVPAPVRSR